MSNSIIRSITRGTKTKVSSETVTISCSITDTSKAVVLLNVAATEIDYPTGIYLKSVSNSDIVIGFNHGINSKYYTVTISYQIIEFM